MATHLLATLYRHFPRCEGRVEYMEVGTPLTNIYYLKRPDSYGLMVISIPKTAGLAGAACAPRAAPVARAVSGGT